MFCIRSMKLFVNKPKQIPLRKPIQVRHFQVTVLGASNEVGQTTSLLLRYHPLVSRLVLHDWVNSVPGISLDLTHIPTGSPVTAFVGDGGLEYAIKGSDVVIATDGAIQRPGMTYQQRLAYNAKFIKQISEIGSQIFTKCIPMPIVGIVTEPINTVVPMAAEVMRNNGNLDSRRLFGITTTDIMRSQCIYAADHYLNADDCFIPVICGHSNKTMVPLLSQTQPQMKSYCPKYALDFTERLRNCDEDITRAKKGWSAVLTSSYSASIFVKGVLEAMDGRLSKVNAFVENNDFGTGYFSGIVKVDSNGYGEMQRYDNLSEYEVNLLEHSLEHLRREIKEGNKILESAGTDASSKDTLMY